MRSFFPQTWHRMGGNTVTDELGLSRAERREAFDDMQVVIRRTVFQGTLVVRDIGTDFNVADIGTRLTVGTRMWTL